MSEDLSHTSYTSKLPKYSGIMKLVTPAAEAHELAVDMVQIGAIALSSEVEVVTATGQSYQPNIPNPITPRMLRPRIEMDTTAEGSVTNMFSRRPDQSAVEADSAIQTLQEEVGSLVSQPDGGIAANNYLKAKIAEARQAQFSPWSQPFFEMIMDGADKPALFDRLRAATAAKVGGENQKITWKRWLHEAPDSELTNFSQWYTAKLTEIANPETRPLVVEKLKNGYRELVSKGMQDGWIDPRHYGTLNKKMKKTGIAFFSPFGKLAEVHVGMAQVNLNHVMLPVATGPQLVIHELGHAFAGVSIRSFFKYYEKRLDRHLTAGEKEASVALITILNEGFNDHMTAALLKGSPEVIDVEQRKTASISEVAGHSDGYEGYRNVFGALANGADNAPPLNKSDIRSIVNTMIDGDFEAFGNFINSRWGNRNILAEAFTTVDELQKSASKQLRDLDYNSTTKKLLEVLRDRKAAPR